MNESISQYVYLRLCVRDLDSVRAENCWLPLVMLLSSIILGCQFVVKYSKMSIISTSATTAVNYSTAATTLVVLTYLYPLYSFCIL